VEATANPIGRACRGRGMASRDDRARRRNRMLLLVFAVVVVLLFLVSGFTSALQGH